VFLLAQENARHGQARQRADPAGPVAIRRCLPPAPPSSGEPMQREQGEQAEDQQEIEGARRWGCRRLPRPAEQQAW
jgi:hypothetical protein